MKVVATAPSPGVMIPRRPVAGAIDLGTSPEADLANFSLRCVYDFARRGAAIAGFFAGLAGAALGASLTMRIGRESMFWVAW